MKIKVGVIFGGESVEHEVSIISACQAMKNINTDKYDIVPIYITKDREWYTGAMLKDIEVYKDLDLVKKYAKNVVLYFSKGRYILRNKKFPFNVVNDIDIALPVVHGTNVEDGVLQGYLQSIGIPFTGGDVYASVVGQDKVFMKDVFKEEGLPMTKYVWFYDFEYKTDYDAVSKKLKKLEYPLIVKPATVGSSIGISVAKNEEELKEALDEAVKYDKKILVEEVVQNLKEVNISVLGNYENSKVSEIEEVYSSSRLLTYDEKYLGGSKTKGAKTGGSKGMASASRKIPASLDEKMRKEVEDIALRAFKVLSSSGVVRIDFLIDEKEGKVYINEINSIPGSLAFYLWDAKGVKYSELLDDIISIGVKDYKKRIAKTHSFETNILKGFNGIKGAKGKLK